MKKKEVKISVTLKPHESIDIEDLLISLGHKFAEIFEGKKVDYEVIHDSVIEY